MTSRSLSSQLTHVQTHFSRVDCSPLSLPSLDNDFDCFSDSSASTVTPTGDQGWAAAVQAALNNLSRKKSYTLEKESLFSIQDTRLIVKNRARRYFNIFPWFLMKASTNRCRECLNIKKDRDIDKKLVAAMNYFWETEFSPIEIEVISTCYSELHPPEKYLSPIIQLQEAVQKRLSEYQKSK